MSEKPDIDQMAQEYQNLTKNGLLWSHRARMDVLFGWDKTQEAIRRALETRKLMGL